ncbi:MAG: helix-hairpin-helix domain-containing protein [Actinomycetales bacterium]|nr:helix-hairpin-helix domain-containing protein [Actinomycetales bacterium]
MAGSPGAVEAPAPGPGPDPDADDLVARLRSGALSAAATAYTAAHGHPLEHPDPFREAPTRRWGLTGRAAVVVGLTLLVVAGAVVLRGWTAAPSDVVPLGGAASAADVSDPFADPAGEDGARLVVHVVGAVNEPGVVELTAGARVAEAVEAAGGATGKADLGALNLARTVEDGEQVVVPRRGQGPAGEVPGESGAPSDPRVDLNAADATLLETLPGIGPVLAERIVTWRTEHGRFSAVEELLEVSGIGPSLFGQLEGLVRV